MQTNRKKSGARSSPMKEHREDGDGAFNDVLRRMLSTPPDPKKDKAKKPQKKKPAK